MIVLEGPDGSGKTQLAHHLAQVFSLDVAEKVVGPDTSPLSDVREWVEKQLTLGFQFKVFDRFSLISESIYGPIMRGSLTNGHDDTFWLTQQLRQFYSARPILVYCLPPIAEVRRNVDNPDTQNSAVGAYTHHIYAGYVNRASLDFANSKVNAYWYDYLQPGALHALELSMRSQLAKRGYDR